MTPSTISIMAAPAGSSCDPRERHEHHGHQSRRDEGDAEALQARGHVAVLELLADPGEQHDGECPAGAAREAVHDALRERVGAFDHEQRAAEDRAVDGDERQEDAERVVQRRHVAIEEHLEDLHDRRHGADVGDQSQEAQVHAAEACPLERAALQQVVVDQVVGGHGDGLHHDHRDAEAERGLHLLRDGEEGAHAEEERQCQVLDEQRLEREVDVVFHHCVSVRCTTWIW
jgi:hypothetical protein